MEKEKSNIQNLSVCYCLMKRESSNQTGTVRMSPMTEMLNHVQAFYENKGASVYSQAFVYGNQNAFARAFEQYPFGFRAGMEENVEKYNLTEMLVLCCGLLEDYLPGSEENRWEEEIKDVYRLVIISDYPLNTDSEAVEQLVNHIKALKRQVRFLRLSMWILQAISSRAAWRKSLIFMIMKRIRRSERSAYGRKRIQYK